MSPIRRFLATFTLFILLPLVAVGSARGQAVAKADPRALAMGGGYVAVADGSAALQWNPAGLWVSGRNEVALTFGNAPFEGGPWVEALRVAGGFSTALDELEAAATLISRSAGLAGERVFGAYVATKRFGGAFQHITYVDEVTRAGDDGIEIAMASLRTREFQFSAAHPFAQGRFVLGGSAKIVQAQGRLQSVALETLAAGDLTSAALLGTAGDGLKASEDTVFAVDVGALFMATSKLRIGGVVKNLNAPGLHSDPQGITRLPRQIRVGGLFMPTPAVKMTLDVDLSSDLFVEGGRDRRELGGGLEWSGERVALRGGLMFDMQAIEQRPTYTLGVGVSGKTLRVDLGGSWAPDRDGFGWIGALAAEF